MLLLFNDIDDSRRIMLHELSHSKGKSHVIPSYVTAKIVTGTEVGRRIARGSFLVSVSEFARQSRSVHLL